MSVHLWTEFLAKSWLRMETELSVGSLSLKISFWNICFKKWLVKYLSLKKDQLSFLEIILFISLFLSYIKNYYTKLIYLSFILQSYLYFALTRFIVCAKPVKAHQLLRQQSPEIEKIMQLGEECFFFAPDSPDLFCAAASFVPTIPWQCSSLCGKIIASDPCRECFIAFIIIYHLHYNFSFFLLSLSYLRLCYFFISFLSVFGVITIEKGI